MYYIDNNSANKLLEVLIHPLELENDLVSSTIHSNIILCFALAGNKDIIRK